ncbi:hypothetical protein [Longitalea arenae]|uniref:hypothetical protein n=1 Tax=Longitalea arenae TaxID=2812558 RepID=UPI0019671DC9|nr:hypothetical protein [Longitalea arenae]
MDENLLNIELNIEKNESLLVAHLVFSNSSSDEIYLDSQTICADSKTHRNVFKVLDEKNNEIDYVGRFVNRQVRREDFIPLKGGQKIKTDVVLNDVYKVLRGHRYFVQYSVFHPTYMEDAEFTILESNIVEVFY